MRANFSGVVVTETYQAAIPTSMMPERPVFSLKKFFSDALSAAIVVVIAPASLSQAIDPYPGYQRFFLACDEELRRPPRPSAEDTSGDAARKKLFARVTS